MYARVATFSVDDPEKLDGEIETTRRYTEGDRLPDGIPAAGFLMLVDREGGKVVEVLLFASEDDLRRGARRWTRWPPGTGRCTASRSSASRCRCR